MTKFFNKDRSNDTFSIQLPYLNKSGSPMCVEINQFDAENLVNSGTHKIISASDDYHVLTPIKTAATNVVFQLGCDPV